MDKTLLSQLKPINLSRRMKLVNPASPPTNAELEIKPVRILTYVASMLMIIAGLFIKATNRSSLWDPAISPAMTVGIAIFMIAAGLAVLAFAMFSRRFRDGLGFANFVALMPGSLWRLMREKAEFIRRITAEADAFDADLAKAESSPDLGQSTVDALAERRKSLVASIDPLTAEILTAFIEDESRENFLRERAFRVSFTPKTESVMADSAKRAHADIMAAGAELGIKPGLLARHIAYLKRGRST